ncbi:nitroreductase family protein, partial [Kitasatospora sp. NPDC036755]|uniref:nitroreductase family protein n=1 Tax=Kitasatospora sp. NPDC036755 TaxID=3154600 RepID=UPI0033C45BAD
MVPPGTRVNDKGQLVDKDGKPLLDKDGKPRTLEAGHLAQNLLLTSAAFGLGTTPLGGLQDDLAHELLGLDDLGEPIQYLLPLGRPGAAPAVTG